MPARDLDYGHRAPGVSGFQPHGQRHAPSHSSNIVSAGRARDPLAVWNGVLIDGHNRFEICTRLALPFDVSEVDGIESRDDAMIWIIDHQFGRRNLTGYTRGVLALKREPLVAAKNKAAQVAAGEKFGRGQEKLVEIFPQAFPARAQISHPPPPAQPCFSPPPMVPASGPGRRGCSPSGSAGRTGDR